MCRMKKEDIRENVNETYTEIRKINLNFHNNKFYQFMGALRFITIDEEETLNMLKLICKNYLENLQHLTLQIGLRDGEDPSHKCKK